MNNITKMEEAEGFLSRFYRLYDGVVKLIRIEPPAENERNHKVTFEISTKDSMLTENYYVLIRIIFENVEEYCLKYGPRGYVYVLSFGAVFTFQPDDTFFVDFLDDEPRDVETIRESEFYLRAKSAKWEIVTEN